MFKSLKRKIFKMFREFLVYHNSSLEFRAKILTLVVSTNSKISECENIKLKSIASAIYPKDNERAEILIETIYEYHQKIITNNGLNFEHLIQLVMREVREVKRFSNKIDINILMELHECTKDNEENRLFQLRVIEFLEEMKKEHGSSK